MDISRDREGKDLLRRLKALAQGGEVKKKREGRRDLEDLKRKLSSRVLVV